MATSPASDTQYPLAVGEHNKCAVVDARGVTLALTYEPVFAAHLVAFVNTQTTLAEALKTCKAYAENPHWTNDRKAKIAEVCRRALTTAGLI